MFRISVTCLDFITYDPRPLAFVPATHGSAIVPCARDHREKMAKQGWATAYQVSAEAYQACRTAQQAWATAEQAWAKAHQA